MQKNATYCPTAFKGGSIRTLFVGLLLLVSAKVCTANAQGVKFEIKTPLVVAHGEDFRIEFILSSGSDLNDPQFTPPTIGSGLSILSGPVAATGMFMSDINGRRESLNTITYTYWVKATNPGKTTVSAASVSLGGKPYASRATTIEALSADQARASNSPSAGGANAASSGSQSGTSAAASSGKLNPNDILLRMEVSKTDVYKGEPLVASIKISTCVNITGLENPKYPALNGFWAQELPITGQSDRREVIGGREYHTQILRQWLLYPQRSGTLEIEQAQFTALVQLVTQAPRSGDPRYDIFYGGLQQVQNLTTKLATAPVKVKVKELPMPQPAGFNGAVGRFELTGIASGDRLSANSAGSITLRLSGTGNFPLIEAPKITLPAAFEQYDTKTTERLTTTPQGTNGERTYEYPFIARAEGNYTIPGVELTYFDPATGKYNTLNTGDFPFEIQRDENGGEGASGLGMVSGVTKEDLKLLGQDIRFIRLGSPGLGAKESVLIWSATWVVTVIGLILLFVGLLYTLQKRIRERADLAKVKTKKANKVALRRLKRAKSYMAADKEGPFFEEMLRALWGYMGDKLTIDVANLTKERVLAELEARGVSEEQGRELLGLISECEFAQYSPAAGIEPLKAYGAALDLIGRFENKI